MDLGAFSVSLPVADLGASRAFYEALGFDVAGGDPDHGYLVLRNGTTTIGLFEGMFEEPILTFNPRLGQDMRPEPDGDDVRDIHAAVVAAGLEPGYDAPGGAPSDEWLAADRGAAGHFVLADPDGHAILVDQFDEEVLAMLSPDAGGDPDSGGRGDGGHGAG